MHTKQFKIDGNDYVVFHNGDWSGDITISGPEDHEGTERDYPSELVAAIAAEMVRDARRERLESLSSREMLGLPAREW